MKRLMLLIGAGIFGLSAVVPSNPVQAGTWYPSQAIAIMSVIRGCGGPTNWTVTFHLYSSLDGGLMAISPWTNLPGWWSPSGWISSDSKFTINKITVSDSKRSFSAGAWLHLVQNNFPTPSAYKYAEFTASKPNC